MRTLTITKATTEQEIARAEARGEEHAPTWRARKTSPPGLPRSSRLRAVGWPSSR